MRSLFRAMLFGGVFVGATGASAETACTTGYFAYKLSRQDDFETRHKNAIFQIRTSKKTGTGFMVTERLALTAAHVVADGVGNQSEPIEVYFHDLLNRPRGTANIVDVHPTEDVALLEVDVAKEPENYLHGLPIVLKRRASLTAGRILSYGFADKPFGTEAASPYSVEFSPEGDGGVANSRSTFGDSGSPVIHEETGHVIAINLGQWAYFDQNDAVFTTRIVDWLIRAIPEEDGRDHLRRFKEESRARLIESFKPLACERFGCWENQEIARVVTLLWQDESLRDGLAQEKLDCPLLAAAEARGLSGIIGLIEFLMGYRTADLIPTAAGIEHARQVKAELGVGPGTANAVAVSFEPVELTTMNFFAASAARDVRLGRAEQLLADAAMAAVINSPESAGRFCEGNFAPSAAFSLNQVAAVSGTAERVPEVAAWLGGGADAVDCGNSVANEDAAVLFAEAAEVARSRERRAGIGGAPIMLAAPETTPRAAVYYAAAAGLSDNAEIAHDSFRGLAWVSKETAPALAARSALSAYGLGIDANTNAQYYNRFVTQAEAGVLEDLGLPEALTVGDPVAPAAILDGGNVVRNVVDGLLGGGTVVTAIGGITPFQ